MVNSVNMEEYDDFSEQLCRVLVASIQTRSIERWFGFGKRTFSMDFHLFRQIFNVGKNCHRVELVKRKKKQTKQTKYVVECFQLGKRINKSYVLMLRSLKRLSHVIACYVDASHTFPGLAILHFSFAYQYRFLTREISTSHIGNKYRFERSNLLSSQGIPIAFSARL